MVDNLDTWLAEQSIVNQAALRRPKNSGLMAFIEARRYHLNAEPVQPGGLFGLFRGYSHA